MAQNFKPRIYDNYTEYRWFIGKQGPPIAKDMEAL